MQQRALAAAGFAGQRHALAGRDVEVDPAQHRDLLAGGAIGLGQIPIRSARLRRRRPCQVKAQLHCGFWNFSTNSSTGTCGRNTAASRGSSGLRRKSASATSLKPAASISWRTTLSSIRCSVLAT